MKIPKIKRLSPGDHSISAADYNAMADVVEAISHTSGPDLFLDWTGLHMRRRGSDSEAYGGAGADGSVWDEWVFDLADLNVEGVAPGTKVYMLRQKSESRPYDFFSGTSMTTGNTYPMPIDTTRSESGDPVGPYYYGPMKAGRIVGLEYGVKEIVPQSGGCTITYINISVGTYSDIDDNGVIDSPVTTQIALSPAISASHNAIRIQLATPIAVGKGSGLAASVTTDGPGISLFDQHLRLIWESYPANWRPVPAGGFKKMVAFIDNNKFAGASAINAKVAHRPARVEP